MSTGMFATNDNPCSKEISAVTPECAVQVRFGHPITVFLQLLQNLFSHAAFGHSTVVEGCASLPVRCLMSSPIVRSFSLQPSQKRFIVALQQGHPARIVLTSGACETANILRLHVVVLGRSEAVVYSSTCSSSRYTSVV